MSSTMVVIVNGEALLEYDREKALTEKQQQYLERMDQKMDAGIVLGNESISSPDQKQKAQFVAFTLLTAINKDDEATIAAMCSYLADRYDELKQVKADIDAKTGKIMFDLIFDREHMNQVRVSFDA